MLLRKAIDADYDFFFYIKSEPENMYWTGHEKEPNYEQLKVWFFKQLESNVREILILEVDNNAVGYAYVDFIDAYQSIETAVAVSNKFSGLGYGSQIVSRTVHYCQENYLAKPIQAWILDDNLASIKIHEKAGYRVTNKTKDINEMKLLLYQV
ncbi:hypothetical protein AEA09_18255 [Lysinibacillus contaminans]|uniref:N-acetyltransferase domain-containing protein n=1 Tax=Lysinibacillus contaminans TaxID=1293441 RepID=A0ABR5JWY6_9BACI|nr:GNAT family N-acetyltransferase [Lysinibacillus contaminans]KOS66677.1 hypothetical protein AEA09_18255 [Lysinibacillus contaminans]